MYTALALLFIPGVLFFHHWTKKITPKPIPGDLNEAHTWLQTHTPKRSQVFLDDWDEFSGALLMNTHNTYPVGLDPMYTAVPHPEIWDLYRKITRGKAADRLPDIFNRIGCRYVLVRYESKKLYDQLVQSTSFEQVFPAASTAENPIYGRPGVSIFAYRGTGNPVSNSKAPETSSRLPGWNSL
jgi:hypothetical protein